MGVSKEMDDFSSHYIMLVKVLEYFDNKCRFLELGTGYGSTPIIIEKSSFSIHLETNENWYQEMKKLERPNHIIELFKDYTEFEWNNCKYFNMNWDAVLIDNAPGGSRQSNLVKLKDNTKIIICHDTEELYKPSASDYKWNFDSFKYVYTDKTSNAYTTICSNWVDLDVFRV